MEHLCPLKGPLFDDLSDILYPKLHKYRLEDVKISYWRINEFDLSPIWEFDRKEEVDKVELLLKGSDFTSDNILSIISELELFFRLK